MILVFCWDSSENFVRGLSALSGLPWWLVILCLQVFCILANPRFDCITTNIAQLLKTIMQRKVAMLCLPFHSLAPSFIQIIAALSQCSGRRCQHQGRNCHCNAAEQHLMRSARTKATHNSHISHISPKIHEIT